MVMTLLDPKYKIELPSTFKLSGRSPRMGDLTWMHWWLTTNKNNYSMKNVLEFGCGVTSWFLFDGIKPDKYVAMETYKGCVNMVSSHIPQIQMITTNWDDIPKIPYDVMFVDGSAGAPKGWVPVYPPRIFRADPIKYAEGFISEKCIVILHDHDYKGWVVAKNYVVENGYLLLDSFRSKHGTGIYQRQKQ